MFLCVLWCVGLTGYLKLLYAVRCRLVGLFSSASSSCNCKHNPSRSVMPLRYATRASSLCSSVVTPRLDAVTGKAESGLLSRFVDSPQSHAPSSSRCYLRQQKCSLRRPDRTLVTSVVQLGGMIFPIFRSFTLTMATMGHGWPWIE